MNNRREATSRHGRDKNIHTTFYSQNLKGKVYVKDLGIVGKQYEN
jgi:hypothetical protein